MNETEHIECVPTGDTPNKNEGNLLSDITKELGERYTMATHLIPIEWKHKSGIYKIVNTVNNKYYVGSSKRIFNRLADHIYTLRKNKHDNKHLQRSFNKYGEKCFQFSIVEEANANKILIIEQKYLDLIKNDGKNCYNMKFVAEGSDSGCMSLPEVRMKISQGKIGCKAYNKGIPMSKNQKIKLSKVKIKNTKTSIDVYKDDGCFIENIRGAVPCYTKYNISESMFFNVLRGTRKSAKGYVFRRSGVPYTKEEIEHVKRIKKQRSEITFVSAIATPVSRVC
jgi:group I intron endonuclease